MLGKASPLLARLKSVFSVAAITLCFVTSPLSFANEQKQPDKYEGIEITVNINQASAEELADLLSGVGIKKAQAIVEYRQANGKFSAANDLTQVKGIGEAIVTKNADRIKL
ncbi:helix-hairpin-helix domain-containing protein [Vibrio cholerae]